MIRKQGFAQQLILHSDIYYKSEPLKFFINKAVLEWIFFLSYSNERSLIKLIFKVKVKKFSLSNYDWSSKLYLIQLKKSPKKTAAKFLVKNRNSNSMAFIFIRLYIYIYVSGISSSTMGFIHSQTTLISLMHA